VLILSEFSYRF